MREFCKISVASQRTQLTICLIHIENNNKIVSLIHIVFDSHPLETHIIIHIPFFLKQQKHTQIKQMADYLITPAETTEEHISEPSTTSPAASTLATVNVEYIPNVTHTIEQIIEKIRSTDNNNLQLLIEIVEFHKNGEELLTEFTNKLFQIIQTEKFLPKLRHLEASHKFIPTIELKNELYQLLSNKGLSFYVTQDGILEFYSAVNLCPHDIHSKAPDCLCIYRSGILIYDREIINKHPSLSDFFELLKQMSTMDTHTNALLSYASVFHSALADFGKDIHALITFVVSHSNLLNIAEFWEPVLKDIQFNFFQHETIKSLIFCKESSVPLDGFRLIKSSNDYKLRDYGIHTRSTPKDHPGKRSNPSLVTYDDIVDDPTPTQPKRQKISPITTISTTQGTNNNTSRKDYITSIVNWIKGNNINNSKHLQNYTPYLIQQVNDNFYRSVEGVLGAYFENKYKSTNEHRSSDHYLEDFANQTQKYIYFYETNIEKRFWCFISDRSDSPFTNIELRRLMEDDFHFICCFKPSSSFRN